MASPTLKELKYRKFDDLINEIYVDLPAFNREGLIEPGQLIKVAQRINQELGLKIHTTKEAIIDVEHGRAKLPSDFYILNMALLCHHYEICEPSGITGRHTEDVWQLIPQESSVTTCPCWTIVAQNSQVNVTYCDGTQDGIFFPANDDGSPRTTKMCLKAIDIAGAHGGPVTATTDTFCYNIPGIGYSCNPPDPTCCTPTYNSGSDCGATFSDPWKQNRVFTTCNNTYQVNVIEYHSNSHEIRKYQEFEKIHMRPSKEASAFCVNTSFVDAPHQGHIKDGFLWVPTLRRYDSGRYVSGRARAYICYLGTMEDEQGNLLVLDHPKINDYYEWAIKERIFENAYLNGETDILQRLQLCQTKLKTTRAEALSIVTMPDFYELKQTIEMNRKAAYHKYIHPFSSLWGNTPGSFNNDIV